MTNCSGQTFTSTRWAIPVFACGKHPQYILWHIWKLVGRSWSVLFQILLVILVVSHIGGIWSQASVRRLIWLWLGGWEIVSRVLHRHSVWILGHQVGPERLLQILCVWKAASFLTGNNVVLFGCIIILHYRFQLCLFGIWILVLFPENEVAEEAFSETEKSTASFSSERADASWNLPQYVQQVWEIVFVEIIFQFWIWLYNAVLLSWLPVVKFGDKIGRETPVYLLHDAFFILTQFLELFLKIFRVFAMGDDFRLVFAKLVEVVDILRITLL